MAYDAGTAFLQVVPSFQGAVEAISAEAEKWGTEMGRVFKQSFEAQVQDLKIAVDLNDTMAKVKLDELKFDEARVGDVNVDVNVDGAAGAVAELGAVKLAADSASGSGGGGGGLAGLISQAGLGLPKMYALGLAAAVLAPGLIAIAAAAAGAALGLAGMLTAAVAGAAAFGLAALPIFTGVSVALAKISLDQLAASTAISAAAKSTALAKLNADLASLSPTVSTVVLGILGLKKSFMNWDKQFDPAILKVFSAALADVMPALRPLAPLVNAGALGLTAFFKALGLAVASPAYSKFIDWLAKATGPAMSTLTTVFGNLASGFASMLENSGPLIPMVEKALIAMSAAFDKWAKSKAFKDFVAYAVVNLPIVVNLLEQLSSLAIWVIDALAPFGTMILREVEAVITFFAGLPGNIKNALGDIFHVITTAFGDVGSWVNLHIIQPVVKFFTDLPGNIRGALGDAKTMLYQVGVDIVTGLWNGITSMAGWLKSKIEGLAGNVVGWAKGILGIHSPSLVFHQMGLDIGQGLANGMLASMGLVTAAGKGMLSGLSGPSLTATVGMAAGAPSGLAQLTSAPIMASLGFTPAPVNLSGATAGGSVLAALQRIESAIHVEGAAQTGAAVSTKVNAQLGNALDRHAKTTLMLSRTGAY